MCITGSGHPDAPIHIYTTDDGEKLYVFFEAFCDNTFDHGKDYAAVHIKDGKEVKTYKVHTTEKNDHGRWYFDYTENSEGIKYEHMLYVVEIPLSEINNKDKSLELGFEYYGTASSSSEYPSFLSVFGTKFSQDGNSGIQFPENGHYYNSNGEDEASGEWWLYNDDGKFTLTLNGVNNTGQYGISINGNLTIKLLEGTVNNIGPYLRGNPLSEWIIEGPGTMNITGNIQASYALNKRLYIRNGAKVNINYEDNSSSYLIGISKLIVEVSSDSSLEVNVSTRESSRAVGIRGEWDKITELNVEPGGKVKITTKVGEGGSAYALFYARVNGQKFFEGDTPPGTYAKTFTDRSSSSPGLQTKPFISIGYGYTISYNGNGGTGTMVPVEVVEGSTHTLPANGFTAPEGKEFVGWKVGSTTMQPEQTITVNANTELVAQWRDKMVTVSYNGNGGIGTMVPVEVAEGSTHTLPANVFTAPEGKEFAGWKVGSTTMQPGQTITVNANTELVAQWRDIETPVNTYTVTYDSNGGTLVATETVEEGEKATEPTAPTREGYTFAGWYTEAELTNAYDFDTAVTSDITLYAKWTEDTTPVGEYKITVIGGKADKYTAKEGDIVTITANTPYNFRYWSSDIGVLIDDINDPITSFVMEASDVVIEANYKGSIPSYPSYPNHSHFPSVPKSTSVSTASVLPKAPTTLTINQEVAFNIGSKTLVKKINGTETKIEMDVEPFIAENRTMIPIRFVAEALGFDVAWDNTTRIVTLTDKNIKVEIPVDTKKIIVNGTTYESDVAPIMRNNRTYLSISNVAKALGLKEGTDIIWKADTREVIIKRSVTVK